MSLLMEQALTPMAAALTTTGRDIVRGATVLWRGTIGLIGVLTLLVGLALFGSEQVREQLIAASLSLAGLPVAVKADEPARADLPAQPRKGGATASAHALNPGQEQVTRFLSRRYKVAESAVRQIVGEAFLTGRSLGVDPLLILAVMAVESGLNPFAQSPMGAQGLMQVMTRVHSEKFADHGGDHAALDPIANLKVGSTILRDLIRQGGSIERGLQLYVGAGNAPDDGGYGARVLAELARLKSATGGNSDALAGLRAGEGRESRPAAALRPVGDTQPSAAADNHAT
jgi:soluble lytic murein transglycosylase-like protein